MDLKELKSALEADGWKIIPPDPTGETGVDWAAARPGGDLPPCVCNDRPPQVTVEPWQFTHPKADVLPVVNVGIRAQAPSGWVDFVVYGLPLDLGAINRAAKVVAEAWRTAFYL